MTQIGHAARARSPFDKEACVGCTGRSTASLAGNTRLAALALIHSVHNHTDDDGNDSTTHTTADQREIGGLEVHSLLLNMVLHQTPGITKGSDGS